MLNKFVNISGTKWADKKGGRQTKTVNRHFQCRIHRKHFIELRFNEAKSFFNKIVNQNMGAMEIWGLNLSFAEGLILQHLS